MISVVIPTLNAEANLEATLAALVPAAVDGLIREVIIADGGSTDRTLKVVDQAGAELVTSPSGRGQQMMAGARTARFPWLLFLHADTELEAGYEREVAHFIERVETGRRPLSAAAFRFALDDVGVKPRLLEKLVAARCATLRWPYGDQGLLIPRRLYDEIGGFKPQPLMEDLDLVRRLGRARITMLRARAMTSAARYRREGYARRIARNQLCLALHLAHIAPTRINRIYDAKAGSPR